MTTEKAWIVSSAAAVLSLGLSVQPHPVPFWQNNIVIAAEEPASANSEVDTEIFFHQIAIRKDSGTSAEEQFREPHKSEKQE